MSKTLTNQQLFDNALFGVRNQNYVKSIAGNNCVYVGENCSCAIGHSIPLHLRHQVATTCNFGGIGGLITKVVELQELFGVSDAEFEASTRGHSGVPRLSFMRALQAIHDGMSDAGDFELRMRNFASSHGLVYTPVNQQEAA